MYPWSLRNGLLVLPTRRIGTRQRLNILSIGCSRRWYEGLRRGRKGSNIWGVGDVKGHLEADHAAAEKISATGLFGPNGHKLGDRGRVNIVSQPLVDDIVSYVGREWADRHHGCDLIDLYPGVGVWSTALHDLLQPRSHVLFEPDDLYKPMLEPLLARPGCKLIPESGIIWSQLRKALSPKHLPHQREQAADEPYTRNDTLLVTANVGFFPKKKWVSHRSIAALTLYQLATLVPMRDLFYKYGLVRILVWCCDDEKMALAPVTMQARVRSSLEAELNTEWIHHVAFVDPSPPWTPTFARTLPLVARSFAKVLERMNKAGLHIPRHRLGPLEREVADYGLSFVLDEMVQGRRHINTASGTMQELDELKARAAELNSDEQVRMRRLTYQKDVKIRSYLKHISLCHEFLGVINTYANEGEERGAAAEEEFKNLLAKKLPSYELTAWNVFRDNYLSVEHFPIGYWDKRPYEPLRANPREFFPNVPLSLLDMQPKAPHALMNPFTDSPERPHLAGEVLLKYIFSREGADLDHILSQIWFGAAEAIKEGTPSLRNPAKGGIPLSGSLSLSARQLTSETFIDMLDAYLKWPFRPTYTELIARVDVFGLSEEELEAASKHQEQIARKKMKSRVNGENYEEDDGRSHGQGEVEDESPSDLTIDIDSTSEVKSIPKYLVPTPPAPGKRGNIGTVLGRKINKPMKRAKYVGTQPSIVQSKADILSELVGKGIVTKDMSQDKVDNMVAVGAARISSLRSGLHNIYRKRVTSAGFKPLSSVQTSAAKRNAMVALGLCIQSAAKTLTSKIKRDELTLEVIEKKLLNSCRRTGAKQKEGRERHQRYMGEGFSSKSALARVRKEMREELEVEAKGAAKIIKEIMDTDFGQMSAQDIANMMGRRHGIQVNKDHFDGENSEAVSTKRRPRGYKVPQNYAQNLQEIVSSLEGDEEFEKRHGKKKGRVGRKRLFDNVENAVGDNVEEEGEGNGRRRHKPENKTAEGKDDIEEENSAKCTRRKSRKGIDVEEVDTEEDKLAKQSQLMPRKIKMED